MQFSSEGNLVFKPVHLPRMSPCQSMPAGFAGSTGGVAGGFAGGVFGVFGVLGGFAGGVAPLPAAAAGVDGGVAVGVLLGVFTLGSPAGGFAGSEGLAPFIVVSVGVVAGGVAASGFTSEAQPTYSIAPKQLPKIALVFIVI